MHIRTIYTGRILQYKNTPLIKVITGMRRVGKSILLKQVMADIQRMEPSAQCVYLSKEDFAYDAVRTAADLHHFIQQSFPGQKYSDRQYLFIDEIQEIAEWEKAIVSLLSKGHTDIYITGSNAHLLSSELATLISGRYIEIQIFPLSLSEFALFKSAPDASSIWKDYLKYGGLPVLHHMEFNEETAYPYLNSLWNTILLKDVVARYEVRSVDLLQRIALFVFDNLGHIVTAKSIADYLKSQRVRIGVETVQNYLQYLASTYVINKVPRYDIKGKKHLEIYEKYFLGDVGLRHALLGYRETELPGVLENIVYLALRQRGYAVSIGKIGELEVDFIAVKEQQRLYIQVAYLLATPEITAREVAPFLKIPDHYPKWVVSLDEHVGHDLDGVKRWYLPDFLLSNDY
jgi:hypothetical protein